MSEPIISAAVNLTEGYPADTVTQTGEQIDGDTLVVPPSDEPGTRDLKWSHGPVSYEGWINLYTYEMKILPILSGFKVGIFEKHLIEDGFVLKSDLNKTKGELTIYVKNGNEIWTHLGLQTIPDHTSHVGDFKLFVI